MPQARLEEFLRFAFIALKSIWRCHQFMSFGHKHCPEQVRIDSMERAAQPNIKEIGKVGIADVVIIGWVGRNKGMRYTIDGCHSIALFRFTWGVVRRKSDDFRNPINRALKVASRVTEWVCFGKIPNHRDCLTCKSVTSAISCYIP